MENIHIKIEKAYKSFKTNSGDDVPVLKSLDLDVRYGEFLSILGPSGCGKSTLINILAKQDELDSGTITYLNATHDGTLERIAAVWQEESLLPWKTAQGNVEFSLLLQEVDLNKRGDIATTWLQSFGLDSFKQFFPAQLSQGMRKRVALAAALAVNPSLLLMDEPFSALDVFTKLHVEKQLIQLWDNIRCTIIMVTHDVQEAVALSDRIVILKDRPTKVVSIKDIPLQRPRNLDTLYSNAYFHSICREIWADLLKET